jgi:uncharacterized protein (TIGR02145 family)
LPHNLLIRPKKSNIIIKMKNIFYCLRILWLITELTFQSCKKDKEKEPEPTEKESVIINGIRWSTRNVDMPGTFAATREDLDMLYQWNSNIGWSTADPAVNSNGGDIAEWDSEWNGNDVAAWEAASNPCPCGWRVPTHEELVSLAKTDSGWGEVNGVTGRFFGGGKNTLFLPAAGYRNRNGTIYYVGTLGYYWSSSVSGIGASFLGFGSGSFGMTGYGRVLGFSVRCIAEQ